MSIDINLTLSALKVSLGFAHDGAVRARCYTTERQLSELMEVGSQMDKARILHLQLLRAIDPAPKRPLQVIDGGAA